MKIMKNPGLHFQFRILYPKFALVAIFFPYFLESKLSDFLLVDLKIDWNQLHHIIYQFLLQIEIPSTFT